LCLLETVKIQSACLSQDFLSSLPSASMLTWPGGQMPPEILKA
jgi:hypothetical protein